ncbi:hypothetical protein GMD78_05000 [Ornithinibacillus sp. L9]|uniref:YfzA-like protein n=1 Tax=Ornithinibacillus caprae TaxID=2678566 RepID=A0A6N8FJ15_9BACI|nr:YfzA family protein [Ornithinibacillus caprae]MUK87759.1 hypothetical protein [Ornithinibacillus caprae]
MKIRKTFRGLIIHIIIFVVAQLAFLLFDGYTGWHIFNLNPGGEWVVVNLNLLTQYVQLYDSQQLNGVTALWGLFLFIHGLVTVASHFLSRREKPYNGEFL